MGLPRHCKLQIKSKQNIIKTLKRKDWQLCAVMVHDRMVQRYKQKKQRKKSPNRDTAIRSAQGLGVISEGLYGDQLEAMRAAAQVCVEMFVFVLYVFVVFF